MKGTTMNLGEQLKANLARSEAEANRIRLAQEAAACEEARKKLEAVEQFFEQARREIVGSISAGEIPKPIKMGKSGTAHSGLSSILQMYQTRQITDPGHEYHFAWAEFATWAKDNGLVVKLEYAHDGVGIESWHELVVKAI